MLPLQLAFCVVFGFNINIKFIWFLQSHRGAGFTVGDKSLIPLTDPNYQILNEYDPLWPNDYHKIVQGKNRFGRAVVPDPGIKAHFFAVCVIVHRVVHILLSTLIQACYFK